MSFHAEISNESIKSFTSVIDALAGFGEELHVEARKSQLILWSINMSMTSQAVFRFSPRFFEQYKLKRPTAEINGQRVKEDSLRSRILQKTIRAIFRKNANFITSSLSTCHLDQSLDTSCLQVKLVASDARLKTHSLWYGETDPVRELYTKNTQHRFSIDPGYFLDYLQCMHPLVVDVAMECTPDNVKLKSYSDSTSGRDRPMHSEFTINSCDFAAYVIRRNIQLVFSLKEFKAALAYAVETRGLIEAFFDEPGGPIVFNATMPGLVIADFALITKAEEMVPTQISGNTSGISYQSRASRQ
ncbi:Rad9/Ddc1 [Dichotomocladium elegans]|nr:Rad9/Ddc1 [Dichotomocladium elegans]